MALYDNNHGNEVLSIINALSGILILAEEYGADEADCKAILDDILNTILTTPRTDIKKKLVENCYTVQLKDGYFDVGYLLSLRF